MGSQTCRQSEKGMRGGSCCIDKYKDGDEAKPSHFNNLKPNLLQNLKPLVQCYDVVLRAHMHLEVRGQLKFFVHSVLSFHYVGPGEQTQVIRQEPLLT